MKIHSIVEADLAGKRVIVRAGFDVSIENGVVMDTERVEAVMPTIEHILNAGGSVVILSHQGRPKGKRLPEFTQKPVTAVIEKFLKRPVTFVDSCVGPDAEKAAQALKPGEVLFLENLRYEPGEEKNDGELAKALAKLGDVYVNDAFTNCHRAHASVVALAKLLPSYAGLQLMTEIENLSVLIENPPRPVVLIVSGAKMETKVPIVEQFLKKGDDILLGGCIANTFIAARGFDVGSSKFEQEFVETAKTLMLESEKEGNARIHVPADAVVASSPDGPVQKADLPVEDIEGDMSIFDVGVVATKRYADVLAKAKTIVWNGPLGLYENEAFAGASKAMAKAIAQATKGGATTIIGGGDTIDFHTRYGLPLTVYTFVSTGGGAMLEFIGGKSLPAIEALER